MEYITITDFQGLEFSGFEVRSRRELPKTAKLRTCTYTDDFREVTTYSTNKKHYIFIKKTL